jgi:hypothetical protein
VAPDSSTTALLSPAGLVQVRDAAADPGQPLERVHGLEVSSDEGVHPRAVDDGVLPVKVDELPEREGVSDEVGGGVLEEELVRGCDRLADVRGEALGASG